MEEGKVGGEGKEIERKGEIERERKGREREIERKK